MTHDYLKDQAGDGLDLSLTTMGKIQEANLIRAGERGDEIVVGDDHTILIDLDDTDKHEQLVDCWDHFVKSVPVGRISSWLSKSYNIHIKIDLEDFLTPYEIVLWQLLLGSDPERERWNAARITMGQTPFQHLFKPAKSSEFGKCPILLWCRYCHKLSTLSNREYREQMLHANATWRCLNCREFRCGVIEA